MKKVPISLFFLIFSIELFAQNQNSTDSSYFTSLNRQIDHFVVQKNASALDSLYAEDFVFSHGTGLIEGKTSWLKTVANGNYPSREHDSMTVEMHPALAIVRGKLSIQRIDKSNTVRYILHYIRLFALRSNRWQMISHITTDERHL